jgi:magnesium transporter
MSEQKYYHFSKTGLFYALNNLDEAISAMAEGGYIWLNYYDPGKEELMILADKLGIHPLSVEDCLDNSQVPKIEHFADNTFIIFNAFHYADKTIYIDEINFFIGKNFLITVSGHNSEGRKPFSEIGKIISNDPGNTKLGPAHLLHRILDYVVDQKINALEAVEDELEISEDVILDTPALFDPAELMRIRKSLQLIRKSLFHEREILVKICRLDCQFIKDKVIIHYRDIYDHLAKFFELAETYREVVTSLMELYSSLQNNLMNRSANETNSSVRRLTLIATVFMPLTLIASIGGMSEWSMMTGPSNWKVSYPLFILAMVIIAAVNFIVIRRIERKGRILK